MSDTVLTKDMNPSAKPARQINIVLRDPEPRPKLSPDGIPNAGAKPAPHLEKYAHIVAELDEMIGLKHVKQMIYEIYAMLQVNQLRLDSGLIGNAHVYHMIFKGNPGTGKTTVARIIARLFHSMGVLEKGHMIEAERADLVGEYIGHTALKTRELVKRAMGGILFIDEAYSLGRGGEKDFGKEAIDTLVKAMEDHKDRFVLILAGYTQEMEQFMELNPGLPSRFPLQMEFPDYSLDELIQIAELMVKERDYSLLPQTVLKLRQVLGREKEADITPFSNARYVRNTIERAIRRQAVRLLDQHGIAPTRQDLMMLRPDDLAN